MAADPRATEAHWFTTKKVAPRTWAIDDHGGDLIYFLAGEERGLLVDTGWGVGDLPALVASLTSLPFSVVNTHGHPDHTLGNGQFERIHIHSADEPYVRMPTSRVGRREALKHLPGPLPPDFDVDAWARSAPKAVVSIQEGHVFGLGGRVLEVVALPGHSPGSICLLDRDARLLLSGDSIHSGTIWLHLEESIPLGQFLQNLQRVQGLSSAFDYILPGHGRLPALPLSKRVLADLVTGIERILSGEIAGREEKTFAGDGLRCDFGPCGIIYRADRL